MRKLAPIAATLILAFGVFLAPQSFSYAISSGCAGLQATPAVLISSGGVPDGASFTLNGGEIIAFKESWAGSIVPNVSLTVSPPPFTVLAIGTLPQSGTFTVPRDGTYSFAFDNPGIPTATVTLSCNAPYVAPYNPNYLEYAGGGVGTSDHCITLYANNAAKSVCDLPDGNPAENTQLIIIGKYRLYRLRTGEYQLNIGPDVEGKEQVIVFLIKPIRITKKYEFNLYSLGK